MKWVLSAIGVAALLFLLYRTLERPETIEQQQQQRNVILISIDTVRADYLQIYNSGGVPTPNLQKIADRGFLFTNAIAQVPFTLPSHSTMLTGTYPMKHLVQENIATRLGDDAVTLAEVLKSNGYQTAGFIGSLVLESGTGIEQGFDTYDDVFVREHRTFEDRSGIQKDAATVKRSFLRWLDERNASSPFFSFVHFYDPHTPYDPPKPFRPDSQDPKALYRGELQYVDSIIGELVQDLTHRNLMSQSILVITGDHGEMLGEHGENGHGFFIYQEAVRVPLLISLPDHRRGKSDAVLELVDLMPTILDLLQIQSPPGVQGKSFAKSFDGQEPNSSGAGYSESLTAAQHFGAAPLRSIQDARYKYIDGPQPELYDLQSDATEQNNLVTSKKQIAAQMKAALDKILSSYSVSGKSAERELTPEQQEQLAALGYIGGSGPADHSNSHLDAKHFLPSWNDLGRLNNLVKEPDCRECLVIVNRIQQRGFLPVQGRIFAARAHIGLGNHQQAISILHGIVSENPKNSQAQLVLAASHTKAGNTTAALEIYRKLMEEDSILGLENYAELMIRLRRNEELQRVLDQYIGNRKMSEKHYPVIGEIYLLLQQRERSREFLLKGIEASPENPSAYIHLASLMDSEGKTREAIAFLEEHRGRFQTADYLLQLGRLYGKTGNIRNEHELFQQMVKSFPNDPRGYFFLGKIILQQKGDMQQVIRLAETGLRLNPDPEFQPFGYFLLGDAYTSLGENTKAQSYLKKAEELRNSSAVLPVSNQ